MKKQKSLLISTIVLGVLSIAFTLLICLVDKSNIGPQNSSVGLSKLNQIFKNLFGYNELFYKLTQVLGYIVIGLALAYMVIAFIQLIKRKSIKNIDIQLSLLAIFYAIIIAIYFVFELAKINYRPVILDGELEPSYPSSHTMLAVFICTTSLFVNGKIINNKTFRIILDTVISIIGLVVVIGRIISGVHWITDIIGAILISTTLTLAYLTITNYLSNKNKSSDDKEAIQTEQANQD